MLLHSAVPPKRVKVWMAHDVIPHAGPQGVHVVTEAIGCVVRASRCCLHSHVRVTLGVAQGEDARAPRGHVVAVSADTVAHGVALTLERVGEVLHAIVAALTGSLQFHPLHALLGVFLERVDRRVVHHRGEVLVLHPLDAPLIDEPDALHCLREAHTLQALRPERKLRREAGLWVQRVLHLVGDVAEIEVGMCPLVITVDAVRHWLFEQPRSALLQGLLRGRTAPVRVCVVGMRRNCEIPDWVLGQRAAHEARPLLR